MYPTQSAGKRLRTSHDWFQFYFDSDWTAKRRLLLKSAVSALSWWHRQDYSLGNLSNNEKLAAVVLVPQNLLISRSCFAEDDNEMYTCTAIFSLIKPFVWWPTPTQALCPLPLLSLGERWQASTRVFSQRQERQRREKLPCHVHISCTNDSFSFRVTPH